MNRQEIENRYKDYVALCITKQYMPEIQSLVTYMYRYVFQYDLVVGYRLVTEELIEVMLKKGFCRISSPKYLKEYSWVQEGTRYCFRKKDVIFTSYDSGNFHRGALIYNNQFIEDFEERPDVLELAEALADHTLYFEKLYQRAKIEYRKFLAEEKQRRIA